jgi:hypothetical protein
MHSLTLSNGKLHIYVLRDNANRYPENKLRIATPISLHMWTVDAKTSTRQVVAYSVANIDALSTAPFSVLIPRSNLNFKPSL